MHTLHTETCRYARMQRGGFQGQDAAILSLESIPRAEKGLTGKAKPEGNGQ